jgi:peptidoglycan/LPS O-acetylase OafA/YrhL
MNGRDRIEILDWLRGLAALNVAWFHFTVCTGLFRGGWLDASGAYGYLGVEAFFVISGFVIPYSMMRGGYRGLQDAGTFVLKRLTRLEPPYLVSVVFTVALIYAAAAAPGFHGTPPQISVSQLLLHVGYLNVFFGRHWINPVYWTLAIELQFYLSMILLFPLLAHTSWTSRAIGLAVMAALALPFPDREMIFPFLGLFAMGACAFQYRVGLIGPRAFLVLIAGLGLVSVQALSPGHALVGVVTALLAAFANPPRIPAIAFLGSISYSFYLLHGPIGGKLMNLAARLPATWHGPAIILALCISFLAALGLWWFVERPSMRLSAAIRYPPAAPQRAIEPEPRAA